MTNHEIRLAIESIMRKGGKDCQHQSSKIAFLNMYAELQALADKLLLAELNEPTFVSKLIVQLSC